MIQFNDLKSQWAEIKQSVLPEIEELFESSQFILGPQVERFEKSFADFCSCDYGIGVSNGTDAIKIAAKSLELTSSVQVFMPANTFVATWLAIKEAYPQSDIIMIDIDENGQMDTDKLQDAIEVRGGFLSGTNDKFERDKLIVAVHMYGCCDNIDKISKIATEANCMILEDASQSHGARSKNGTLAGSVGEISAFSLYPGKNLGGAGDAGIIVTNNEKLATKCKMLRNYGSKQKYIHEEIGYNNRLDTMQAIILYWKLKHLAKWNKSRAVSAEYINLSLDNHRVRWMLTSNINQVYHILPVLLEDKQKRNQFMKHLNENSIQCGIHYPIPIHKMPFYKKEELYLKRTEDYADRIVSLPIHPFLKQQELEKIVHTINNFN
tara:strand:+ start:2280 stop:3416 length:1137 start_codon:yes stop_codon:yes gene_type:complete